MTAVPRVFHEVYDKISWNIKGINPFKKAVEYPTLEVIPKYRKKPDTTKFTQVHYDFVIEAHAQWLIFNEANPKDKKTRYDLIQCINEITGLNKSISAYARIWRKELDRDSLPVGQQYFTY